MQSQLELFEGDWKTEADAKAQRSGTFLDNMALPIHRWYRYSAGFAAKWVEQVLMDWGIRNGNVVLDPFAGSGTVSVVCDRLGITSIGVEAHPVVSRIAKAKLLWETPPERVRHFAGMIVRNARDRKPDISVYPQLVHRSFSQDALAVLDTLRCSWVELNDSTPESELVWLALTAILRPTSKAGTAQWQYIQPRKIKKKVLPPLYAFQQHIELIASDIRRAQETATCSHGEIIAGDARNMADRIGAKVDAVVTSPPLGGDN